MSHNSRDGAETPALSRTMKRWIKVIVFTVGMFACHLGALLVFTSGILQGFGRPAVLMLLVPSLVCWGLLFLLLMRYKKYRYPVSQRIEALMHDQAPLFPPQSMVTMYHEIKAIEKNIRLIREKNKAAADYIRLLKKNAEDPAAKRLLDKYKEYNTYFNGYYAGCCSAYLNKRFQFYMALIKEILLPGEKIHTLDIERFIDTIKADLDSAHCILTDHTCFDKIHTLKTVELTGPGEPPVRGTSNRNNGASGDMIFDEIAKTMADLNKKIPLITVCLISAQSHKTIAGISPVDEKNLLDIYKKYDFEIDIEHLKQLEDEFDRFTAEKELSGIR